ncbi:hydroxyacid dehydrogenase [Psychromicrobium xiongbiense]|uniref:hydroxyacid dehydrogenase n=1 Tax=Psychromicrobium xiongbiense TaxID=3051184 RepID=UPI0025554AF2|nr:hydroxyacid dehydrogenase [Psychromicrobium sp. YIM S02556]
MHLPKPEQLPGSHSGGQVAQFALADYFAEQVYPDWVRQRIRQGADVAAPGQTENATVLFTGWGAPQLNAEELRRYPALQAVFHGAGSVRELVSEALWDRGIRVSTAAGINADRVATFTLAQVILALKGYWRYGVPVTGGVQSAGLDTLGVDRGVVGLVGLGRIARRLAALLQPLGVEILAYDPIAHREGRVPEGVHLVGLPELFSRSRVVSVHLPLLPSTRGMLDGALLDLMQPYSTLINTARGGVIDTPDLVAFLTRRPDITALLDVTEPEPLPLDHPLRQLSNVRFSPHIAGCIGSEVAAMGAFAADEFLRFCAGQPWLDEVTPASAALSA